MPEEKDPNKLPDGPRFPFGSRQFKITAWATLIILGALTVFNYFMANRSNSYIDFSEFKKRIEDGVITRVELDANVYYGMSLSSRKTDAFGRVIQEAQVYRTVALYDPDFIRLLDEKGVAYAAISREGDAIFSFLLTWVFPFLLLFLIWRVLSKRMASMGSGMLAMGQNKAVVVAEGDVKTRFKDVAGADEAKEELVEVVDFLKNPKKYTEIGGRIPKGVLLVGPPGTGKTLLARAVAGEAKVPFFRMSGAEFVEMFVGVGASRVRDLFQKARSKAPCIVFIDELDAIGKSRINSLSGNDEREQTLNQLLVEMDGFDATSGLILLAATNRPDVLDPALLRPGRFDRQVLVDRPDLAGREAILEIHAKQVKLGPDVDLKAIARATPGFVGADLANVINESALLAVRSGRKLVSQADLMEAIEKAVAGLQKKSRIINPEERKVVAVHETGHALMAGLTEGADPVQKISIVPRGFGALGYTIQMPTEDRYLMTRDELDAKIEVLLGGRAAEELSFGKISTGAANDLTKATDIARSMIVDYGMSEKFKNVALTERGKSMLGGPSADPFLRREYSESTQSYVDEEIARIIAERYEVALGKLAAHRPLLDKISELLLEKETLDEGEFKAILEEAKSA